MLKRGFTLIELLVVIAIIAILAAILFPVFAQARGVGASNPVEPSIKQFQPGLAVGPWTAKEVGPTGPPIAQIALYRPRSSRSAYIQPLVSRQGTKRVTQVPLPTWPVKSDTYLIEITGQVKTDEGPRSADAQPVFLDGRPVGCFVNGKIQIEVPLDDDLHYITFGSASNPLAIMNHLGVLDDLPVNRRNSKYFVTLVVKENGFQRFANRVLESLAVDWLKWLIIVVCLFLFGLATKKGLGKIKSKRPGNHSRAA